MKGKSNVVEVYDLKKQVRECSKAYGSMLQGEIKGLISFEPESLTHLMIDSKANVVLDKVKSKKEAKVLFTALGENVQCMGRNPHKLNDVAIGSKDQLLQIWDVNSIGKQPKWMAKNLPNDELDLKIPIWDTSLEYLSRLNPYSLVTCTAYCDVREYDTRCPRKPVTNVKLFGNESGKDRYQLRELYLSKIMQSQLNENHVYTITQEGHPILLDRRQNYKILRKMPGAKGSVRDAVTRLVPGIDGDQSQEVVITCGCDRFVRIYDPMARFQHFSEIGHIYLKQRLNSLLVSQ